MKVQKNYFRLSYYYENTKKNYFIISYHYESMNKNFRDATCCVISLI